MGLLSIICDILSGNVMPQFYTDYNGDYKDDDYNKDDYDQDEDK